MRRGNGLTPFQFVLLSIFSIRKGLIKDLGSDENREERFTSKPTAVTSYQELISCHTVSLPHQKTLSSLDLIREPLATMTPICLPPPEAVVSSGRVEKSPHEQEIKFFAKVRGGHRS